MRRPSVIAHRGASGYEYENSRAAFRRAVMLDADGVELDVHATRDGAHRRAPRPRDPGFGPIGQLSLAEARQIRIRNGEPLPLLARDPRPGGRSRRLGRGEEPARGARRGAARDAGPRPRAGAVRGPQLRSPDRAPPGRRCGRSSARHPALGVPGRSGRRDARRGSHDALAGVAPGRSGAGQSGPRCRRHDHRVDRERDRRPRAAGAARRGRALRQLSGPDPGRDRAPG